MIGPPWTRARRQLLIDSRVKTTQAVLDWSATRAAAAACAGDAPAPSASTDPPAMTGSRRLSRARTLSSPGCAWNAKRRRMPAEAQGIRAVNLRIGLVLGRDGGIFPRLALPASSGWPRGSATAGSGCPGFTSSTCCASSRPPSTSPALRGADQCRRAGARTPGRISARAGAQPAPAVTSCAFPPSRCAGARRDGGAAGPGPARGAAAPAERRVSNSATSRWRARCAS